MTPPQLRKRWSSIEGRAGVLGFYGHSRGEYRCLSNFFDQSSAPFDFEVPASFFVGLRRSVRRVVPCEFSEKAIMLCKAAVMGDADSYEKIAAAKDPKKAKSLGRGVKGFAPEVWNSVVCSVAFEAVHQKFAKTPSLQRVLLQTGERLIAEATSNDAIWGIGIDTGDPRVETPAAWEGTNILGWALMEARDALRRGPGRIAAEGGTVKAADSGPADVQRPSSTVATEPTEVTQAAGPDEHPGKKLRLAK